MEEKSVVINRKSALLEFDVLTRAWDVDDNIEAMSAESKDGFNSIKERIVLTIMDGRVVIVDTEFVEFTPKYTKDLTDKIIFKVPMGSAWPATDRHKERESAKKLNSFAGEMTGNSPSFFTKLDGRDTKVCHAITSLFLGG